MAETILVTGGSGYVAGWCIVALLQQGYTVRTTLRSMSKADRVRGWIATAVDPADRLSFYTADLTADTGWDAAVRGCDSVLHVASPLEPDNPQDPDAMLIPAREGSLRVLRAAAAAGVKRVVMTSARAAAKPPPSKQETVTDERIWTDPNERGLDSYRRSKTVAELAAWEFMQEYRGDMTLATVLPGAVFGPILSADNTGTTQIIGRLLQGRLPAIPHLGFEVVDVRDLADIHLRAMTSPNAGGERFLAVNDFMWMSDIAGVLRAQLGSAASKVPTRTMPDFVLRAIAVFDPSVRAISATLGRTDRHTSAKARQLLGWQPRPGAETIVDCANSLIAHHAV